MPDDQIGTKIAVIAPAGMARLPPSIITKILFSCKQPSLSAGPRYTYFKLALLYKKNRLFL
jgi:hypothetical protein